TLFLLLLALQRSATQSQTYFGQLFGTKDFALLSQLRCARAFDYDDMDGSKCPVGLSTTENIDAKDKQCSNVRPDSVRVHLVRDVHNKHTPRLLHIYINSRTNESLSQVNYGVEKISLPPNGTDWEVSPSVKETSHVGFSLQTYETLSDSIFDTTSNILYLIVSNSLPNKAPHRRLVVVYASNLFEGKIEFKQFSRNFNLHVKNNDRSEWMENPYEHTVHYLSKSSSKVAVHRLPMSELLSSFIDGKEGEALFDIPDANRELVWAHNGAYISLASKFQGTASDIYYVKPNLKRTTKMSGKSCTITEHAFPPGTRRRLIGIFDWDYCMLKHGGDGRKDADGKKCPINDGDLVENDLSPSSSNTIYVVIIVLLTMVSALLLVYVCWLRRNLDDSIPRDEHKPVPYYPSGQPLDSTFDMSVDRWDQY
ncbi:hypothetical protein PFISCL1PPCAC_6609, partial [Pristionchus fissidentatus]